MIGRHGPNYTEEIIMKFSEFQRIKDPRCRKCLIKFEPEDEVLMFGTKAKRKYYHKNCYKEY